MRLSGVAIAVFIMFVVGCAQTQNADSEKNQTIPATFLSIDDLSVNEIKKLPFDDVLNMFLELDVTRLVNIKDSKDPLKPKIQEVFSRLTNNSRLDENICVIRKIGGEEGNVYAWKIKDDGTRKLEVLQDLTGKDWELDKLSEWIGENIHRIWFDSEGILYIDDELADYGKMDQEYFLPDFNE